MVSSGAVALWRSEWRTVFGLPTKVNSGARAFHRQENQERDHRDHRRLRGTGEHGGEARHDHASDESIGALRHMFDEFHSSSPSEHLHEYSDANIAFHQAIVRITKAIVPRRPCAGVASSLRCPSDHANSTTASDTSRRFRTTLFHHMSNPVTNMMAAPLRRWPRAPSTTAPKPDPASVRSADAATTQGQYRRDAHR